MEIRINKIILNEHFIIYFNNKLNWAISYFFFFENNLYLLFIINQCNNSALC